MKRFLAPLAAVGLLLAHPSLSPAIQNGTEQKPDKADLKPGEYTWEPHTADDKDKDKGAIDIVVSLGAQKLAVYRDGTLIGRSTISSGRKDYETPPGTYMIVQKQVTHHSNKYHEASMPYMERLTWSGLAIHAGNTPGHPESHGCIHVPEDFAKDLYGYTQEGDSVLVAQGNIPKPTTTTAPNALFADVPPATPTPKPAPSPDAATASPSPGAPPPFTWDAGKVQNGPYLIVVNSADKRVTVFRKGIEMGRADLGGGAAGKPLGEHLYAALAEDHQWSLLGSGDGAREPGFKALGKDALPPEFQGHLAAIVQPGTSLVLTDKASDTTKPGDKDSEE